MADVVIRPYEPSDRAALRRLSCETADRGEPVERFFNDRELFADLVTGYYTDWEPGSTWIAEAEGRLTGYLTGCLDTRRYWNILTLRLLPRAMGTALTHGTLGHPQTRQWLGAWLRTLAAGGFLRPSHPTYPAHLHLNVAREFRGRHVGRRLIERFLAQGRRAGVRGAQAAVRGDNTTACQFFERCGFRILSRHPVIACDGSGYQRRETFVYGARL